MSTGRVAIVEDSPTIGRFLSELVEEAGFEVVGIADNGLDGEQLVRTKKPGLLLSDIRMPVRDGIEMTEMIMRSNPLPVVLITAFDPTNPDLVFRAMQAGALEVLPKPPGRMDPGFERYVQQFRRTLKILHGLPVVRRFGTRQSSGAIVLPPDLARLKPGVPAVPQPREVLNLSGKDFPVIAIGASTGGPTIVAQLAQALEDVHFEFVVVAQHIVPDFLPSFRDWLQSMCSHEVKMAESGEEPRRGVIYLAPPSTHLVFDDGRWRLRTPREVASAHIPSIDLLFESLVPLKKPKVAILLTGMGQDGAAGMRLLKDSGTFTIVQDPGTAVVPSMPQTALQLDAASVVLRPSRIEAWLKNMKP